MSTNTPPQSTDPFSLVEKAIWASLEGYQPLADLVKPGNRIQFSGDDSAPVKDNPQLADCPELAMVPAGGSCNPAGFVSSNSAAIVQRFLIGVITDEQRTTVLARGINAVKYRVFQACERMEHLAAADASGTPFPLGLPFVKRVRLVDFVDALAQEAIPGVTQPREIDGWSFTVTLEVTMVIPRDEVTA